uniref:Uncharacterized protein n=1 Tax=Rhizophora mucronata TaxID=61149 RepID=A0A2P2PG77_RHIMU
MFSLKKLISVKVNSFRF